MTMKHAAPDKLPLFEPWLTWEQLAPPTRQQTLDVLTALYLETVSLTPRLETDENDATDH